MLHISINKEKRGGKMMKPAQVQIQSLVLISIVLLGILLGQSEAFLKQYRRCVGNCVIDCACIHRKFVPSTYCTPMCLVKCAKCLFKKCTPIHLPPPPYFCNGAPRKSVPEAYYFCISDCTCSLDGKPG